MQHALRFKRSINIEMDRFKDSEAEQPELSNHIQMEEKTAKNTTVMEVTHSLSRYP